MKSLRERKEWKLFAVLPKADGLLASLWWVALVLRGILPAFFGIAMGLLVAAVQRGSGLAAMHVKWSPTPGLVISVRF